MILIFITLATICFAFILNELYRKTYYFMNIFADIDKIENYCNENIKYDIINLGSNHPKYAFNYSEITEYKCANWAVGPETLEYDFFILRSYHKHIKDGGSVIIPICPLKMFLYKHKNTNSYLKYYRSKYRKTMPDYSIQTALKEYYLPLLFHPKRIKKFFISRNLNNKTNHKSNPLNRSALLKDADYWIKECWNPQFNIDIENMQPLSDKNIFSINKNIKILRDMVNFCKENNLTPIICYLPMTNYLSEKFSEDFIALHIKRYVQKAINKKNVIIIDMMKDEKFTDKDLYFNSFFMNQHGAIIFTKNFIEKVKFLNQTRHNN